MEGAGHRTQGEAFLSFVMRVTQNEHAVQIVVPVAGNTIQIALSHQRSLGQQIATLLLHILNPALQKLDYASALRQQDGQTLANIIYSGEVFQITAQLIVVTLQGFSLLRQICVQLFLLGEGHAVNTLQHFAFGIAAPVSAGSAGQLNSVALNAAGGVQVGTGAQIGEIALLIEADDSVLGQIVNELYFIGLFLLFHEFDSFSARQLKAF